MRSRRNWVLSAVLALLLCPAAALATDKHCGQDTDHNGTVDNWCPTPDEDGDGFTTDGTGDFSTGTANVVGAQATTNVITVNSQHPFVTGMSAAFFDSVSATTVTRDVLAWTDNTITVGGNAVTVANNALISAGLVYDPDDRNAHIRPGTYTTVGCPAGQFRTGLKTGSFTACAALSTFTCHFGSGQTYFVDDAETDCSGTGAYADPRNYLCFSNSALSGYHSPVSGDCFAHFRGAYSGTWTPDAGVTRRQIFILDKDGTPAAPIRLLPVPGDSWWEAGFGNGVLIHGEGSYVTGVAQVNGAQSGVTTMVVDSGFSIPAGHALSFQDTVRGEHVGRVATSTTATSITFSDPVTVADNTPVDAYQEVIPVDIQASNHVKASGFEIDEKTGGYSNSGIHVSDGGVGNDMTDNYVHDINGEEDNNLTCIKFRAGANYAHIAWNDTRNCYERIATTGDSGWNSNNNSQIRAMDCDGLHEHHNVVTASSVASNGISHKHAVAGAKGCHIYRNIVFDTWFEGIGLDGIPNSTIHDNYVEHAAVSNSGSCIRLANYGGGTAIYDNVRIFNNFTWKCGPLEFIPEQTSLLGRTILNFHDNVCIDDRATAYPGDGVDGFLRYCFYCDNNQYNRAVPDTLINDNCYWNSAVSPPALAFWLFTDVGSGNLGGSWNGLTAWANATGFDTRSKFEDPGMDSIGRATSTNCSSKGIRLGAGAAPTPTPTPTPSPTPTPPPNVTINFGQVPLSARLNRGKGH